MSSEVLDALNPAFGEAVSALIVVAVRGALLFGAVFMGKLLGTGFFSSPSRLKVVLISMPIAILIAAIPALYGFKWVVNPGETTAQAIYDAELTFFFVLLPLWTGCLWGAITLNSDRNDLDQSSP